MTLWMALNAHITVEECLSVHRTRVHVHVVLYRGVRFTDCADKTVVVRLHSALLAEAHLGSVVRQVPTFEPLTVEKVVASAVIPTG